jgi:hypothetical protein
MRGLLKMRVGLLRVKDSCLVESGGDDKKTKEGIEWLPGRGGTEGQGGGWGYGALHQSEKNSQQKKTSTTKANESQSPIFAVSYASPPINQMYLLLSLLQNTHAG